MVRADVLILKMSNIYSYYHYEKAFTMKTNLFEAFNTFFESYLQKAVKTSRNNNRLFNPTFSIWIVTFLLLFISCFGVTALSTTTTTNEAVDCSQVNTPGANNTNIVAGVEELLSHMTLAEKIGQMMLVSWKNNSQDDYFIPADVANYHLGALLGGGGAPSSSRK